MDEKPYDIRERTFVFAHQAIAFCRHVSECGYIMRRLAAQLGDAATSVGANVEEAADGQSKRDFIHKNCIALKERREACYWLRLIGQSEASLLSRAEPLIQESRELRAILATIIATAKTNRGRE